MRKYVIGLVVSVGLGLVGAGSASAATVQFDPTGAGGVGITIDLLDPSPGNSLSVGLNATSAPGSVGQLLFQANLGTAQNTVAGTEQVVFTNGTGGRFFTIAAAFNEQILSNSGGAFPTLVFGPTGGGTTGVFEIYAQTAAGSNLNGTCFVQNGTGCPGTGVPILTGTFINNAAFFGTFTANIGAGVQDLDQFGPPVCPGAGCDNYPGVDTVTGTGAFGATILITGVNAGFFPTIVVGQTLVFASTENRLAFQQADPSACFSSNAVTSCNVVGVGSVGPVNGNTPGSNTILQTDANLSFGALAPVPEPATLTLLGLGLVATAAARRRQLRNAKK